MGRRLPVTEATATLITGQKQRTRDRYPATPLDELRLFPALQRNPGGRKPVAGPGLVGRHRAWADSLPPLLLADGTEFPKAKVTFCMPTGTATLFVLPFQPEARPFSGLVTSCLTDIRHSLSHVRQGQDQGLFSSLRSLPLRGLRASLSEMALDLAF
jgi:hypothetical protein